MLERILLLLELFTTQFCFFYLPREDYFPFYAGKKIKNKKTFKLFYQAGGTLIYQDKWLK